MTAASLTSPMPMPGGIGERGDEQEATGARGGDQVLGERVGLCEQRRARCETTVPSSISLLGMMRWSRSMSVTGTSSSTKREPEPGVAVRRPWRARPATHSSAVRGLDDRVARRDRRLAVAAAPAQQQPRQHGDVVVRAIGVPHDGQRDARVDERLAARQPVGDHVEERAERSAPKQPGETAPRRRASSR